MIVAELESPAMKAKVAKNYKIQISKWKRDAISMQCGPFRLTIN
jgi:hypothetical protein